jgi:hypothetical protein
LHALGRIKAEILRQALGACGGDAVRGLEILFS